jgi:hypothetical protein
MSVLLSFLVSSHNNPQHLKSTLSHIRSLALPFEFNIYLALFERDPFEEMNIQIAHEHSVDHFILKAHSHAVAQNLIATASNGRYLLGLADDVELTGIDNGQWGHQFQELVDDLQDDIFAVYGSNNKKRPIIPRRVVETIGYLKCPIFYDLDWCDCWTGSIMTKIGRVFQIPELTMQVSTYNQDPEYFKASNTETRNHERVTFEHTAPVRSNIAELFSVMALPQETKA